MKRLRRRCIPAVVELEPRCVLSSASVPTAVWVGQDGVDLTGPSSTLGPDGVQDIDIALSNLPANETIASAEIYGYGADEWDYNGTAGHWAAALLRAPGATTANFYIEPAQVETGRTFQINLNYADGTTAVIYFAGGTASPDLRMPDDAVQAAWVGQDGHDLTGLGPDVGPDGFQDVDISLAQLSPYSSVQSITVTSTAGETWQYGLNPRGDNNAELVLSPSSATAADLYFSPDTNMAGEAVTLSITYTDNTADQTTILAGPTNPDLLMPAPAPVSLTGNAFSATWLGQDGAEPADPGDVDVAITGLPASSSIASAALSDEVNAAWYYSPQGGSDPLDNSAANMILVPGTDPTSDHVFFAPIRNETGATLTLTVTLTNGAILVTRFAGGACDLALLCPMPAATSVVAQPGDDLNALANEYGNVHLAAGTYTLDEPLVLSQPVTITADPGTTLVFDQVAGDPTWDTAIELAAGNITLEGFSVRFADPVQWTANVSYSPAVIGTPDNYDAPSTTPLVNLTITDMNIQTPPAATSMEQAPSLMRLVGARCGTITDNTVQGGTIEFFDGPWTITGNDDLGTVADTYTECALAAGYTHDVTIADNTVEPAAGAGLTYRFLVLAQQGVGDVVEDNTIIGVGPMADDTGPDSNAGEVILTESYYLHFEGMLSSVSPDGWVVQIPTPQNGVARTGDVLAILTGPQAGQWRTIAQALNANTYLLNAPITPGSFAVSLTVGGFVNETFAGNTVDTTGSATATDMVLAGNQFGVQVLDNTFIGGPGAFALTAYPTETPDIWGWSHVPFLGAVIDGNTIENAVDGALLGVSTGSAIKSSAGRVYLSATFDDNTIVYTQAFLDQLAASSPGVTPQGITVGDTDELDPSELVLSAQGNQVELPPGVAPWTTFEVDAGTVNGVVETNQATVLPVSIPLVPAGVSLVDDNGADLGDGITSNTELQIVTDASAAGYAYSLSGAPGTYQPIATPAGFQPQGLVPGFDVVYVQGYNLAGATGTAAAIVFVDDPSLPASASSAAPSGTSSSAYEYRIGTTGPFEPVGVETVPDPSAFANGAPVLQLQTVGVGGNISAAEPSYAIDDASQTASAGAAPAVRTASPAVVTGGVPHPAGPPVPDAPETPTDVAPPSPRGTTRHGVRFPSRPPSVATLTVAITTWKAPDPLSKPAFLDWAGKRSSTPAPSEAPRRPSRVVALARDSRDEPAVRWARESSRG